MEISKKEREFYLSILENFLSKVNKSFPFHLNSFRVCDYCKENFKVFFGSTKVVLVPKNRGARYVIKIPLKPNLGDWCAAELNAYDTAVVAGLEKFFAEISFFSISGNVIAYLQEKVKPVHIDDPDEGYWAEEDWSGLSDKSIENAMDLDICEELIDNLLRKYSSEEVEEFLEFCAGEHINDIHNCNFGFSKTGVPIIFDYSGIGKEASHRRGI